MRKYVNVSEEPVGNLREGYRFELKAVLEEKGYLKEGHITKSLARLSGETGVPVQKLRDYIYKGEMPSTRDACAIAYRLGVKVEGIFVDSRDDVTQPSETKNPSLVSLNGVSWGKIRRNLGTDADSVINEIDDPDSVARAHEETYSLLKRVMRAAGLTYKEREIVTLLDINQLPKEEVGGIFMLSPEIVSKIWRGAKKKLMDYGKSLQNERQLVAV